jgi:hypothetical protein
MATATLALRRKGQVASLTCHAALIWPQAAAAVIMPGLWINLRQE